MKLESNLRELVLARFLSTAYFVIIDGIAEQSSFERFSEKLVNDSEFSMYVLGRAPPTKGQLDGRFAEQK